MNLSVASESVQIDIPPLRPKMAEWVHRMLGDPGALQSAVSHWGSPLHIHQPEQLCSNADRFSSAFKRAGVDGRICYARKANRCRSVVSKAIKYGLFIDVASLDEAQECLNLGCDPARIICTGATKSDDLLRFCCQHMILVVLDNDEETLALVNVASAHNTILPVAIRLCSFPGQSQKSHSRFGFLFQNRFEVIEKLRSQESLSIRGLQFHLDGYSITERTQALDSLIDFARFANDTGSPIDFVDIGGGMTVDYLQSPIEWESFLKELRAAVLGLRPPITFDNDGLGLTGFKEQIHGSVKLYPFSNKSPKDKFVSNILESIGTDGVCLASKLKLEGLKLFIEPGRALLDQVGVTIARVAHSKQGLAGDVYVSLEMNGSQIRSVSSDFCLDPVLISADMEVDQTQPTTVYLFGNSCMEKDLILKRKLAFDRLPRRGDLLCFPNTAGYHMHLFENSGHSFSLPCNVVYRTDGNFTSDLDEASV